MNTQISLETIYKMLSSLSISNKRWLADHLYQDIEDCEPDETMRQKESLEASVSEGWKDIKCAMEGKKNLQTADDLLKELESIR